MAIYFKFKSAKNPEFVSFDGNYMSVAHLKEKIVDTKKLRNGSDYDIVLSNAQTNEEYTDEQHLVPKSTSVSVRRVPLPSTTIVVDADQNSPLRTGSQAHTELQGRVASLSASVPVKREPLQGSSTVDEFDDFGEVYSVGKAIPAPLRPSTSVLVKREQKSRISPKSAQKSLVSPTSTHPVLQRSSTVDVVDASGNLHSVAKVAPAPLPPLTLEEDEDLKISALVSKSALEWQTETQGTPAREPGYINNGRGNSHPLQGERGRGRGFENKVPPPGYVCHRCRIAGHFIQHCPTNGDPAYDVKKVRPPTGIPKTMLVPDSDGTYCLPTGEVFVLKPNEKVFEQEVARLPSSGQKLLDFPPEYCCPLCKEVMKDAVLTSKCCFISYCDKCIRNEIISKGRCGCGATSILADDLLPNKTLRDAIHKLVEIHVNSSTSSGNVSTVTTSVPSVGSQLQAPKTESRKKRRRLNRAVSSSSSPESGISSSR